MTAHYMHDGGGGAGGVEMAIEHLIDVAGKMPTSDGYRAQTRAAALPSGTGAFGYSPAGTEFAQLWSFTADYHRDVTQKLREGLEGLRAALEAAADRTAAAEAEAAARFAGLASEHSSGLETAAHDFATENGDEETAQIAADVLTPEPGAEATTVEVPAEPSGETTAQGTVPAAPLHATYT